MEEWRDGGMEEGADRTAGEKKKSNKGATCGEILLNNLSEQQRTKC